jgi:hypothetical protein
MQQIILLALTVIIVGIAIVYGIEAFTLNRERANMDSIVQDLVTMGSEAQQWKTRPAQFGGQGAAGGAELTARADSSDYTGFNFTVIGRASGTAATTLDNMNGTFTVESANATSLVISGCNKIEGNYIEIEIDGIRDERVLIQNATRVAGDPNHADVLGC